MEKPMAIALGLALTGLAAAGFIKNREKHVMGMNVDTNHSIIRTPLAAALLLSERTNLRNTRAILTGTGIMYMAVGAIGLVDRKLGGLLPSKLTNFDYAYHFTVGAAALWMGLRPGRMVQPKASEQS